jgi:mitochondrial fission protein ELM1
VPPRATPRPTPSEPRADVDILLLADARAGHFRQSEGLAAAIGRRRDVRVRRIEVRPRPVLKGTLLRLAVRAHLPPGLLLRLANGLPAAAIGRPDLIVSTGSDTLATNVLAHRLTGAPNVFIGTIRDLAERDFTAVLTTFPSHASRPRHVLAAKPTLVDPDRLPPPRPITTPADLAGASLAVLVGGPTPSHRWNSADWHALARLLGELAVETGSRLRITTSRRTPPAAVAALRALAATEVVDTLVIFGEAPVQSLDGFFGADAILVTDDSATMVFEAVAARRPVVTLAPADRRSTRDDEAFDHLAAQGLIRRVGAVAATTHSIVDALTAVRPMTEHPAEPLIAALAPLLASGGLDLGPSPRKAAKSSA